VRHLLLLGLLLLRHLLLVRHNGFASHGRHQGLLHIMRAQPLAMRMVRDGADASGGLEQPTAWDCMANNCRHAPRISHLHFICLRCAAPELQRRCIRSVAIGKPTRSAVVIEEGT
jgi:hypothetical protein